MLTEKRMKASNGSMKKNLSRLEVSAWLVLTTILWGGSFVFNKIGFREVPPIRFMFLRFLLAALLMGLFTVRRWRMFSRRIFTRGFLVGTALAAANLSFVVGVSGTTVSRAGFLNNLFVLIIPLLSALFFRHRLERSTMIGVAIATFGIVILAMSGGTSLAPGDIMSLICAIFIALHILSVSYFLGEEDIFLVTFVQFATVALIGGVMVAVTGSSIPHSFGPVSAGALAYCAVFPTVVCFTIQNTYQRYVTPSEAGLLYTLDPIWSLLGGIFVLGETLTSEEWVGCFLILVAVLVPTLIKIFRERQHQVGADAGI
jgi:drug/metabolite transporter (DMT)-like permease